MPADTDLVPEDSDNLGTLSLSRLPITHPALRKARIIKNARLQSVIELYRDKTAGSGQYDVDNVAPTLGLPSSNADILMLRYVALMPAFDVFSIRLLLRDLEFPEDELARLTLAAAPQARIAEAIRAYTAPLLQFGAGFPEGGGSLAELRTNCAEADSSIAQRLAERLLLRPREVLRFVEDYIDTFAALALYAYWAERLTPETEALLASIKQLAAEPSVRSNTALRTALGDIAQILPDLTASSRKRLSGLDKIAHALWSARNGVALREQQRQVREFQVLIAFLLAGVSAKVTAWRTAFPPGAPIVVSKRAAFFGSEMVHALQQLRDAAKLGTRATSFPGDALRIREKTDTFRAFLRARGVAGT